MSPRGGSWTPEKEALLFRGVLHVLDIKFTQAQYQELSDFMKNEFTAGAISQRITKVIKKAGGANANATTPPKARGTPSTKSLSSGGGSSSNKAVHGSSSSTSAHDADLASSPSGNKNKRKRATAASFFDDDEADDDSDHYSPPPAAKKIQFEIKKKQDGKKARADAFDGARRMAAGFLDEFGPDV